MSTFTTAALDADALCLGPHWIYDQSQLEQAYPDGVHTITDPLSPYHPNRKAGQHTHLGDQVRFLAESIAEHGSYCRDHWKQTWLEAVTNYDGYLDGATKSTFAAKAETPANTNEFAVVSRIAPILDLDLPLEECLEAAQSQASLTHGGHLIPEAIAYFIRVVYRIKGGESISAALLAEAETTLYPQLQPTNSLHIAQNSDPSGFRSVAQKFGQACSLDSAFPLTLYFALHHSTDPATCLSNNALAGGDNTARAMVLAILMAA